MTLLVLSQATTWAEFGAMGAVAASLFGLLTWLLNSHSKERKELTREHRAERNDWKASEEKRSERMETVIVKLTDAIQENNRKG